MNRPLHNRGFVAWETALLVAFVVGIVIVGTRIYDATTKSSAQPVASTAASSTNTPTETPVTTQSAPTVNNAADLTSAQDAIDQVNPTSSNSSDTTQLNSLSNF